MTNLQLEARLLRAAVAYRRVAPMIPDLEPRILSQVAVTPRAPWRKRFWRRAPVIQLAATGALLLFALALAFLIRESRLHQQPQPVTTPTPSASTSPQSKAGSGGGYKYTVYGMAMWHPGGEMVSPTVGWSGGNLLSRTTDGGAHWTNVTPTALRNCQNALHSEYLDATHAWITQDLADRTNVFRTTDGGQTWQQGAPVLRGSANSIQLDFVDPMHGWLLAASNEFGGPFKLYRTADGGLHWQLAAVSYAQQTESTGKFRCTQSCLISFASATTGAMTSLGSVVDDSGMNLLITRDGGASWTRESLPLNASKANCPCYVDRPIFLDSNHGFLVVWSAAGPLNAPLVGHLFVTSDAGNNWATRSLPGQAESDIGFSDPLHGWAIAGSVTDVASLSFVAGPQLPLPLYRTDDGGMTWVPVSNGLLMKSRDSEIRQVDFLDQNLGFLSVIAVQAGKPQFLKTLDGGRTWNPARTSLPPALGCG
ncbi:MAG TPA: hypothetical protein VGZ73_08145 [Bryobacteraceae bacterium]|nr:hypothetical protein [Bryobacteraceae bacterium]